MADQHEETFDSATSGASKTFPKQCSALRKNEFVVIKQRPCKIVEMSTSKTGKHGHAKVHLVALDVFTGKKYEDICPSTHNMECPVVRRTEYQAVSLEDGYLTLMDVDTSVLRSDLKLPGGTLGEDIKTKINNEESFLVNVLCAMGEEVVVGHKQDKA